VIFNAAVVAFGLLTLAAALLFHRSGADLAFTAILAVAGAGAMGVGIFDTNTGAYHFIAAFFAFAGAALASMLSPRIIGRPLGLIGTALGAVSVIALVLYGTDTFLGLGRRWDGTDDPLSRAHLDACRRGRADAGLDGGPDGHRTSSLMGLAGRRPFRLLT